MSEAQKFTPDSASLSFVIEKVDIHVRHVPIDVPVQTSFGTMDNRPAVFLKATDTNGNVGLGEVWCNFPDCGAEHRARLLQTAILPALIGKEFANPTNCLHALESRFERLAVQSAEPGPIAQCIAGLDVAIWDLLARRAAVPLYRLLGGSNPKVSVYASGINPKGAIDRVQALKQAGHNAFKLKIGFGEDTDLSNIRGICSYLGRDDKFMVDANQAWSLDEARRKAATLEQYPVDWLEEPMLATVATERWQDLARNTAISLAAGENMVTSAEFEAAIEGKWLDVIQPDICKWGGISAVLPIARKIIATGKRYCPHYLGGGIGLAASAHLLAAVGGNGLLEIDSNPNPLREQLFVPDVEDGRVHLSDKPGIGISSGRLDAL